MSASFKDISTSMATLVYPADPQSSALLFSLPREIRDTIYLELWKSVGLKQHIFYHVDENEPTKSRYCLWPCNTTFEVEDSLQTRLEQVWEAHERPQNNMVCDELWWMRLQSHWYNHWQCEDHFFDTCAENSLELERLENYRVCFRCPCLFQSRRQRYPYLSMLQSCQRM